MKRPQLVLLPGSRWDDVAGTDRHLAEALGRRVDVVWVEPPRPWTECGAGDLQREALPAVAEGVHRLRTTAPPASTRLAVRKVAGLLVQRQLAAALRRHAVEPAATVLLSPRTRLPRSGAATTLLFVTDDWLAGAPLMGLSSGWVARTLDHNLAQADHVSAVSPELADLLASRSGRAVTVLPNGTRLRERRPYAGQLRAGLVGQLNERLDLEVLEHVAERGVPLLLVGPRAVRDERVDRRLGALLARPNVEWTGLLPSDVLDEQLSRMGVGLTPYADTPFNRASFPLKTLEYLGAGLPVVSTDLPATRLLATDHVTPAEGPQAFADRVEQLLGRAWSVQAEASRRAFARQHSWDARADQLLALLAITA